MERELKFNILSNSTSDELKSQAYWSHLGFSLEDAEAVRMEALYFDTADHLLQARTISLRIRQENEHSVLTIKAPLKHPRHSQTTALFERQEWEWSLTDFQPGDDLIEQSLAAIHKQLPAFPAFIRDILLQSEGLIPLYKASFIRHRASLTNADAELELAVDQGKLIGTYGQEHVHEIEVEMKSGDPAVLDTLSVMLQQNKGLGLQAQSKAARLSRLSAFDFAVIGGGAAGMLGTIAYQSVRPHNRILLIDGEDKLGRKLAASGNGRGNVTNMNLSAANYHSSSGDPSDFIQAQLSSCTPQALRDYFKALGLHTTVEEDRVYPFSFQAKSVVDCLQERIQEHKNTEIKLGTKVKAITRCGGSYRIELSSGAYYFSRKILIASGGEASPKLGSDGSLYPSLDLLGHRSSRRYPALVQLVGKGLPKRMFGQRVHAEISLWSQGQRLARDRGEILITDYGLSGIPVLNISHYASHALLEKMAIEARINLLADLDIDEQRSFVDQRCLKWPNTTAERFAIGLLSDKVSSGICLLADVPPTKRLKELSQYERKRLQDMCLALPIRISDTKGFQFAQVSCGGLALKDFDSNRLESKLNPGLFVAGEILDIHGDCGGFNLNFAFITGMRAGLAAADREDQRQ